jgi:Phasin protein
MNETPENSGAQQAVARPAKKYVALPKETPYTASHELTTTTALSKHEATKMTNPTYDFNALLDMSKKAFAPAAKLNELTVRSFERAARAQYQFAGEMLDLTLGQMQALSAAKDVSEVAAKTAAFTAKVNEKATARGQDLVKFATEAQAEVSKWFDETAAEIAAVSKKAA